jgi:hypothetical protein
MAWKTVMMSNIQKLDKRKTSEILLCNELEAQIVSSYHSEESYTNSQVILFTRYPYT